MYDCAMRVLYHHDSCWKLATNRVIDARSAYSHLVHASALQHTVCCKAVKVVEDEIEASVEETCTSRHAVLPCRQSLRCLQPCSP